MFDAGRIERAQHRPCAVDVVEAPAAIPRSLSQLGAAQIGHAFSHRAAVSHGLAKLGQHRHAAGRDILGRRIEQRTMIGERNVVEIIFEIVDIERGPTAIAALHALDPLAAASDRCVVFMALASAPRAIHCHHHHRGVVEIGIVGIVVLEGPAAGANLWPLDGPIALEIEHLLR